MIINSKTQFRNNRIAGACITLLVALASFAAFSPSSELEIKWLSKIIHVLSYLALLYLLMGACKKKRIDTSEFYLLIGIFFYSTFSIFHNYVGHVFTNYYNILILLAIVLSSKDIKILAYRYFKFVLLLVSVFTILCYISYIFRLGLPYQVASFYEEETVSTVYANYGISYLLTNEFVLFVRACGLFNEPGLMGTICAFVLIIENLEITKWQNCLIFIAGCLTFSFAYVLLLIFGVIVKYGVRGLVPLFIAACCLILSFVFLSYVDVSNESFSYLIGRFDLTSDVFGGDNRSSYLLDSFWDKQMNNISDLLLGFGSGCVKGEGGSTWKIFVVEHGVVGAFLMLFPLLTGALILARGNNKGSIGFVLCFFLSIYQRPQIFSALYFMILLGGVLYINYRNNCKNNIVCTSV